MFQYYSYLKSSSYSCCLSSSSSMSQIASSSHLSCSSLIISCSNLSQSSIRFYFASSFSRHCWSRRLSRSCSWASASNCSFKINCSYSYYYLSYSSLFFLSFSSSLCFIKRRCYSHLSSSSCSSHFNQSNSCLSSSFRHCSYYHHILSLSLKDSSSSSKNSGLSSN